MIKYANFELNLAYFNMTDPRIWDCPIPLSPKEKLICKRLQNTGKLFVFLREHRHRIFDEQITQKLFSLYAEHPRGKPPIPPAQLAIATLLQAYEQKSDANATLDAMFDARWQMVLNCLGSDEPPFSQGVLCDFRHRLIKANMDEVMPESESKSSTLWHQSAIEKGIGRATVASG